MAQDGVSAPIVGATKTRHLSEAVAAVELALERGEIDALERDYSPRAVTGHR